MKATNWEAMARDFAKRMYTRSELESEWDSMVAPYAREVPDGRAAHMLRCIRMADVLCDVTEEEAAALDALPARVAQLEAELKAESDRGDKLGACLTLERAIARWRELRLTDALNLLDEAAEALTAEKRQGLASRVTAFLNAPTSVPEPAPDPRDAFVCFGLEFFASGELPADQAEVFRQHLPGCSECRAGLDQIMEQRALIDRAKEPNRG